MKILEYYGVSGFSKVISWFTRGEGVSHTSVANDQMTKEWQAWYRGGKHWWTGLVERYERIGALHTPGTKVAVYHWDLDEDKTRKCIEYLDSQRGKGYDWKGILGFITRSDDDGKDSLFCSEYAMRASIAADDRLLYAEPYKIAPSYLSWSTKLKMESVIEITESGYKVKYSL